MEWNLQLQIIAETSLALLLGGVIGIEREIADRPAGLRTHMLVAGSAALLVGLAEVMLRRFNTGPYIEQINTDPIRIVEAIVTGISFLGAGTIFRRGSDQVEGLTTAASILFSASVGISVGLHQFVLAIGATLLALAVLGGIRLVQSRWKS